MSMPQLKIFLCLRDLFSLKSLQLHLRPYSIWFLVASLISSPAISIHHYLQVPGLSYTCTLQTHSCLRVLHSCSHCLTCSSPDPSHILHFQVSIKRHLIKTALPQSTPQHLYFTFSFLIFSS